MAAWRHYDFGSALASWTPAVNLASRMREEYDGSGDSKAAVAEAYIRLCAAPLPLMTCGVPLRGFGYPTPFVYPSATQTPAKNTSHDGEILRSRRNAHPNVVYSARVNSGARQRPTSRRHIPRCRPQSASAATAVLILPAGRAAALRTAEMKLGSNDARRGFTERACPLRTTRPQRRATAGDAGPRRSGPCGGSATGSWLYSLRSCPKW